MIMSNRLYDFLRDVAQIYLPALGVLYAALAKIWGFPAAEEISGTVLAVDAALGALLKMSSAEYTRTGLRYDGEFMLVDHGNGSAFKLTNIDPAALVSEPELVLRRVSGS